MKIVSSNDKVVIFLYKNQSIVDMNDYMKKLILKLRRKYRLSICGFYSATIYKNDKIGMIIELLKDDDIDLFTDLVDLKIKVYDNSTIFLKFNDYFLLEKKKVFVFNNCFYIDINDLTKAEFLSMIEFCSIVYGNESKVIKENLLLNKS